MNKFRITVHFASQEVIVSAPNAIIARRKAYDKINKKKASKYIDGSESEPSPENKRRKAK